jgi:hypothetical protein
MSTDAVIQLMQVIEQKLSPGALDAITSVAGQTDFTMGMTADLVQILGAGEGPIAAAAAAKTVGEIAARQSLKPSDPNYLSPGAAAESTALTSAETAAAGAIIILLVSEVLTFLIGAVEGSSRQEDQFVEIINAIDGLTVPVLAAYWQAKEGPLQSAWQPLGVDLDDLTAQGTGGNYVKNAVDNFHSAASGFVNNFVPGHGLDPAAYWRRPFDPADPPEVFLGEGCGNWYGAPLQPKPAGGGYVLDPRSMMPFLCLGLQSYMLLQMLAYFIDPSQPRFDEFVAQYGPNQLTDYLTFLYSQYSLAVNGIVKTDFPSEADVLGGLDQLFNGVDGILPGTVTDSSYFPDKQETGNWGGSPQQGRWQGQAGFAWDYVYGAAETYPPYGIYPPTSLNYVKGTNAADPLAGASCCSFSLLTSIDHFSDLRAQLQQRGIVYPVYGTAGGFANVAVTQTISVDTLRSWVIPWIQNRIVLGTMARWKALYLINGHDTMWSLLQKLNLIVSPDPVKFQLPNPMTLDQDGTIADGNWHARELCAVLLLKGALLNGVQIENRAAPSFVVHKPNNLTGLSMFALVQFLDNIASGNWGEPPSYPANVFGSGPARPLGFRDRLAAAAVWPPIL